MRFSKVVKLFKRYSVSISGSKGSGKDLLTSNVVARRKKPYICNVDYKCKKAEWIPWNYDDLNCGGNTYKNLITGDIKRYSFPYGENVDVYISDAGIYFPAQYNGELNRDYKEFPTYMALSRHLANGRVHINSQNPNRTWDKIREQSDYWIRCRKSFYIFGLCITFFTTYDKYESALNRVRPCRVRVPWRNKVAQTQARTYRDNFYNSHGTVKNRFTIYFNRSRYNTKFFKEVFENA